MAVNKVEYGDKTLIDLTSDTVTKEALLVGVTAHTASGEKIAGEFDPEIYLRKSGGDSNQNIVTFTSDDDTNPSSPSPVAKFESGETHSSLFNKVSTMFKNIRYLLKMLGTANISSIGDGTVTGAVSTLNSNLISLNKFKFNTELTTSSISFKVDKRYDVYIINLITDKYDVFKTVTVMEEIDENDVNMLVEISSPWGTTPAKVLINFDNIQYFNINVSIRELGSFTKVTLSSIIGIKLPLN